MLGIYRLILRLSSVVVGRGLSFSCLGSVVSDKLAVANDLPRLTILPNRFSSDGKPETGMACGWRPALLANVNRIKAWGARVNVAT